MTLLKYKNILFDDWNQDEYGINVSICENCKKAYKNILKNEIREEGGDAYCSVCGCKNNCEENEDLETFYVDFDRNKVEFIEVNENLNNSVLVNCPQCNHLQELIDWSLDDLGHCTTCKECDGSFDIDDEDAEKILIPRGTIVKYRNKFGIIDGYDFETSKEFSNINYAFCQLKRTNKNYWSDDYEWLSRKDFDVIGIFVPIVKKRTLRVR